MDKSGCFPKGKRAAIGRRYPAFFSCFSCAVSVQWFLRVYVPSAARPTLLQQMGYGNFNVSTTFNDDHDDDDDDGDDNDAVTDRRTTALFANVLLKKNQVTEVKSATVYFRHRPQCRRWYLKPYRKTLTKSHLHLPDIMTSICP